MSKIKSAKDWQEQIMYGQPLAIDTIRQIQKEAIKATAEVFQADIRNKLSPISNLIAILQDSENLLHEDSKVHAIALKELHNSIQSLEYLSAILSLIKSEDLKVE